jgi:prepilin-type processing-associated H-X9-DG protein
MATECQDLFPEARNAPEVRAINDRCQIRTQEGHRVVIVSGIPVAQYAVTDRMAEAHAMVNLVEQGWAAQNDVPRTFGYSARTLRRDQRRYEEGGLAALGQPRGYPAGRARWRDSRRQTVHRLKAQGHSNCEIARRLGISETAVRKVLIRMGWKEHHEQTEMLPLDGEANSNPKLSACGVAAPPAPASQDTDPSDRSADRLLARLGLLEDAPPLFGSASAVPRAGVLLALPVLIASGVFDCARQIYGSLGPAFYGLRTSLLTLLLMALWRIKRPENLKEYSPQSLGRVLGLDRAPEVKTLRRKLASLAATGRAAQFGDALAKQRVALRGKAMGFLYVDGHVRVYHGQHALPKAHVARMRISAPATSDYWVNDSSGDPLFVVTAEANAGLVKMLPGILDQVRGLVGKRRVTVVFDRGGFSPKLFQQIIAAGFDLLTYRKGRHRRIPRSRFVSHTARCGGRKVSYVLADQEVRLLKGKLRLRQVTRRMENGHQTAILTSRRDLAASHVAYRMFDRWRQENFFKVRPESRSRNCLNMKTID